MRATRSVTTDALLERRRWSVGGEGKSAQKSSPFVEWETRRHGSYTRAARRRNGRYCTVEPADARAQYSEKYSSAYST